MVKVGRVPSRAYLCNVYVQDRNDAYTVLRDFAAIFRGMTCWSGDRVIALADMPRDIDYTYTVLTSSMVVFTMPAAVAKRAIPTRSSHGLIQRMSMRMRWSRF